jgi:hypothetical protein
MIFSLNLLMHFRLLLSLNCLIPPHVRTWHHFLHQQNHQNVLFSLEPFCHQSHPPLGSIQYVVSYLRAMVLLGQTSNEVWTLDYDNIPLWKVQFLSIIFYGDVLFELLPIHSNIHNPSQMQGMDKKYDGHAWCKLFTMNIKKSFGFSFRKACCLGHLYYV